MTFGDSFFYPNNRAKAFGFNYRKNAISAKRTSSAKFLFGYPLFYIKKTS